MGYSPACPPVWSGLISSLWPLSLMVTLVSCVSLSAHRGPWHVTGAGLTPHSPLAPRSTPALASPAPVHCGKLWDTRQDMLRLKRGIFRVGLRGILVSWTMYVTCLHTGKAPETVRNTRLKQMQLVSPWFPLCTAPCSPVPGLVAAPRHGSSPLASWSSPSSVSASSHVSRSIISRESHHPLMSWPSSLRSRVPYPATFHRDLLHGPAFRFILKLQIGHEYWVLIKIKGTLILSLMYLASIFHP